MKLKKLLLHFPNLSVKGAKDILLTGICSNSKCVVPGNLFIAKKGLTHNAANFIPEAIAAGAVAIVTDFYDPLLDNVVQILHPNPADIESEIAAAFYQYPANKLFTVGVTGTNGKTTTTYLVKHLFDFLGQPCGLIGTVEWIVGAQSWPATHTTPDILANQKLFHEMCSHGMRAVAMEVSSHALNQKRVQGIQFDVGVFTNLTHDHLDYHKSMEQYATAKSQLFKQCSIAILNHDSPWNEWMLKECKASIITYGVDRQSDLMAHDVVLSEKGIACTLEYKGKKQQFQINLIGRFNLYNCLAAVAVGLARGFSLLEISTAMYAFRAVRGRLERVENPYGYQIYVDYAHTDDALQNVLTTLREIVRGKLITVFGCGGDRDRSKRRKMAAVSEKFSDETIVTSDNPRNEDPEAILHEVLTGFSECFHPHVRIDRKEAIAHALNMAKPEDIVLIAGKGHEMYQIFAHKTIDFDDRKVALEALEKMQQNQRTNI